MPRLAEKIRNTQPWCAALLRAPLIVHDRKIQSDGLICDTLSGIREPMIMPWEPGFVVQFPGEAREFYYNPELEEARPGNGVPETLVVTARRLRGHHIELEVWAYCGSVTISVGKVAVREGKPLVRGTQSINQETYQLVVEKKPWWAKKDKNGVPFFNSYAKDRIKTALSQLGHAMQLLQCKNVGLVERQNPPKKRRKGRGNRQVESYWVLDLPGSPRYWDSSSSSGPTGIHPRLHTVRGHFKAYTEEAPLFGKVIGTVWVPSHARGDANLGLIEKDYNLVDGGHSQYV